MSGNNTERQDYLRKTKFLPVILIMTGGLSSVPLWFPGVTIPDEFAWLALLLNISVPILVTSGLVSMFLDSFSTYQYFKEHIYNTLVSNAYLKNLSQEKRSELRNVLLSDRFLSDLSPQDLLQIRKDLASPILERLYGRAGINRGFIQKIDDTAADIMFDKCYLESFEMTVHFHEEETESGKTYMRKVVSRRIEYVNVTNESHTIPIMKPRHYVRIDDADFFNMKCFVNENEIDGSVSKTLIEKENNIYNVKISSDNTIALEPGKTVYTEETSALLPLNDRDMILRMTYPCKSIKIDFIYDGPDPKDLRCWAFCPNASRQTEKKHFTNNHLRLTVQGPLFKGEGIVFRY